MPKGRFLGEFELYVLAALARLEPEAYGMAICREIESRTGRDVAIGSIYVTLARLEQKRLVATRWSTPEPVPGGRARRLARLTPDGRRALAHSSAMLLRMFEPQAGRRS